MGWEVLAVLEGQEPRRIPQPARLSYMLPDTKLTLFFVELCVFHMFENIH